MRIEPSTTLEHISRDPGDDRVLEAAVDSGAQYVITGDADLLSLGTFRGIQIVTPAQFVAILDELEAG